MKKYLLTFFFLINAFAAIPSAQAEESAIDMNAPPFWMCSYQEFRNFQPEQKEFYIQNYVAALPASAGEKAQALEELNAAKTNSTAWENLRKKLYSYCADQNNQVVQQTCQKLARARIRALTVFGNQKAENRAHTAYQQNNDY